MLNNLYFIRVTKFLLIIWAPIIIDQTLFVYMYCLFII